MKKFSRVINFLAILIILIAAFQVNLFLGVAAFALIIIFLFFINRQLYYFIKANKLYTSMNIEESFNLFEKALKVQKPSARITNTYGYYLLKNKNLEKSESVLNSIPLSAMNLAEKNTTKMNLSLVYYKKGNLDEGIKLLEDVYEEYKCHTMYETYGYLLILKGSYERALEINLEAYDYDPNSKVIADNLGETYFHLKCYDEAQEIYRELIEKTPGFPDPYYHYALVLIEKGQYASALENLNKGLEKKESYLSEVTHDLIEQTIEKIKQYQ